MARCTTKQRKYVVEALCALGLTVNDVASLMPEWSLAVIALDVRMFGGVKSLPGRPTTEKETGLAIQARYNELMKATAPLSEEDVILRELLAVWLEKSHTGIFIRFDQMVFLRPITDLELSGRPLGALTAHGVQYVGQLVCMTEREVSGVERIGVEGLQEIKTRLKNWQLCLGTKIDTGMKQILEIMTRPKR